METQVNESKNQLVISLRTKAEASPAFKAMCEWFAGRERTRAQLTMANLVVAMAKEGKDFSREDYRDALKFMADLGLGTLEVRNNKIKALVNIKTTLQSIGQSALSKGEKVDPFRPKAVFKKLPPPIKKEEPKQLIQAFKKTKDSSKFSFILEGETYVFDLPKDIAAKDLLGIVQSIYGKKTHEEN